MAWDTPATAEQRAWEREQRRRFPEPRAGRRGGVWILPAWTGPSSPQSPVRVSGSGNRRRHSGRMDILIAKVAETIVADVVEAVRNHESYKALVTTLAEQALSTAAAQAVAPQAGSSSAA